MWVGLQIFKKRFMFLWSTRTCLLIFCIERIYISALFTFQGKSPEQKHLSTHLWNTPRATFTNRVFHGIPFIVDEQGDGTLGCAISGCVVIFWEPWQGVVKTSFFSVRGADFSLPTNCSIAFDSEDEKMVAVRCGNVWHFCFWRMGPHLGYVV